MKLILHCYKDGATCAIMAASFVLSDDLNIPRLPGTLLVLEKSIDGIDPQVVLEELLQKAKAFFGNPS